MCCRGRRSGRRNAWPWPPPGRFLCGNRDMGERQAIGIEEMHGAAGGADTERAARLDLAVPRTAQRDVRAVRQMHIDVTRLAQALHRIDAALECDRTALARG